MRSNIWKVVLPVLALVGCGEKPVEVAACDPATDPNACAEDTTVTSGEQPDPSDGATTVDVPEVKDEDADVVKDDDDDDDDVVVDPAANVTLSLTPPTLTYTMYGSHEAAARTATFTHDGDSAECSHDSGATWAACDSTTSIVFTAAEHTAGSVLKIRVHKGTGTKDFSFDPKTALPDAEFYQCNTTVSANKTKTEFEALLVDGASAAAPYVICLSPSVLVNATPTSLIDTADKKNIVIVGAGDDTTAPELNAVYINSAGISGGSNADVFKIGRVKINGGTADALRVRTLMKVTLNHAALHTTATSSPTISNQTYASDLTVMNSSLLTDAGSSNIVGFLSVGVTGSVFSFVKSSLKVADANADLFYFSPATVPGTTFNFSKSTLEQGTKSLGYAIFYSAGVGAVNWNFTDSTITGGLLFRTSGAAVFTLTNTKIISSYLPFRLQAMSPNFDTVSLNNVRVEKFTSGSPEIFLKLYDNGNVINDLSPADKKVLVCRQGTPTYSKIIEDAYTWTGNFDPLNTLNASNTQIDACPP